MTFITWLIKNIAANIWKWLKEKGQGETFANWVWTLTLPAFVLFGAPAILAFMMFYEWPRDLIFWFRNKRIDFKHFKAEQDKKTKPIIF